MKARLDIRKKYIPVKTYKHLFEKMLLPDTVCKCMLDAAKHKLNRKSVLKTVLNFDDTYDRVYACLTDPEYKPREDNVREIIDGSNHKQREIEKPRFCPEQILHHLIIEPFRPILLNGLYENTFGCMPRVTNVNKDGKALTKNFGPHAAIKRLRGWLRTNKKTYVCETDIHHAYGSVHIKTLVDEMVRVIKDDKWLDFACKFLHYDKNDPNCDKMRGLVLGHYTSPWFFNFYLKRFDHFAAALDGVKYLRYADNIYFVGHNKRKVHRALDAIQVYLKEVLKLELNRSTQIFQFEYGTGKYDKNGREITRGRAVNALGAVIHYNRTTLRKSILKKMRRKSIRIGKKKNLTWYDSASMLSRLSWIRFTDIHKYYAKYIAPKIHVKRMKRKVAEYIRGITPFIQKRKELIYDRLENSARLSGRAA